MTERLLQAMHNFPPQLMVAVLSALPISELRGGIPAGISLGLPLSQVWLIAVAANIVSVIPVLLCFKWVADKFAQKPFLGGFITWLLRRARSKQQVVEKHGVWALTLFVAIPLPATGAWTGALVASVFGMGFWRSLACIVLGVLIASALVTALTVAGVFVISLAR